MALRNARSPRPRWAIRSTSGRAASSSESYCTPDGHAVTHAMHPRQVSMWATKLPGLDSRLSRCCRIRWIRPRGESVSCPQSKYVGQVGRQKPQCTQSSRRSRTGVVTGGLYLQGSGCWVLGAGFMVRGRAMNFRRASKFRWRREFSRPPCTQNPAPSTQNRTVRAVPCEPYCSSKLTFRFVVSPARTSTSPEKV